MLFNWASRWGVPLAALQDLQRQMGAVNTDPPMQPGTTEAAVQAQVRLEASRFGHRLWRNNVGAFHDENGNFIRFGLANDSKQLNDQVKSSDLVGIRQVRILPTHVGSTIGQFMCREIKPGGWTFSNTKREQAQLRWIELIVSLGGDASFATAEGTIK